MHAILIVGFAISIAGMLSGLLTPEAAVSIFFASAIINLIPMPKKLTSLWNRAGTSCSHAELNKKL
ncbi:hypothetical protein [Neptuniibacter sp. QD37_11]|uniref:hypothetical protein n=1 Tax=Neptuniibacter sp. QD37_11 TaxID=3398209 RepID=UPI0039F58D50